MINKTNIVALIKYLFEVRKKQDAPVELLQKWSLLSDSDIQISLKKLFDSWNFSSGQREQVTLDFLNQSIRKLQADSVSVLVEGKSKTKSRLTKVLISMLIFLICICGIFLTFKYLSFKNLHYIYTLTERVAIRNEAGIQIGTFDLTKNSKTNSFQKLLVYDDDIYSKSIDSSSNLYDHRKVVLNNARFWDFVTNNSDIFAYVNAKYVVDSEEEFKIYLKLFGQLSVDDNKRLQLKHRKIIANCLSFKKSMKNLYVVSSCVGVNPSMRKNNSSIIVHEIITNNKYECIAKLSDGYYYQFIGDVMSDTYMEPRKMGFTEFPNREDEYVTGDFLFRYNSSGKNFYLTNCEGKRLPYETISNPDGSTSYFKEIKNEEIQNPFEPLEEISEDAIDVYKSAKDVLKEIFN